MRGIRFDLLDCFFDRPTDFIEIIPLFQRGGIQASEKRNPIERFDAVESKSRHIENAIFATAGVFVVRALKLLFHFRDYETFGFIH